MESTHVSYRLTVREFFAQNAFLEWTVTRRFSEFVDLNYKLQKSFQNVEIPTLPPKGFSFGAQTEQFLAQRLQG